MKGIRGYMLAVLCLIVLTGCAGIQEGNKASCCYNRLAVWQGQMYYIDESDGGLYRSKPDFTNATLVELGFRELLEVSQEGILATGDRGLFRILPGTEYLMVLEQDFSDCCALTRKWIYYKDYDGGQLKRITRDGVENENVGDKGTTLLAKGDDAVVLKGSSGDTLYLCKDESQPTAIPNLILDYAGSYEACMDGEDVYIGTPVGLCRYRITDNSMTGLSSGNGAASVQMVPQGILYTDSLSRLWLWPFQGNKAVQLSQSGVSRDSSFQNGQKAFYEQDGWVYYLKGGQYTLMRVRTDGSQTETICQSPVYSADFTEGWIYCRGRTQDPASGSNSPDSKILRIRTDGSGEEPFLTDAADFQAIFTPDYLYTITENAKTVCFSMNLEGNDRQELNQPKESDTTDPPEILHTEHGDFYTNENGGILWKLEDGNKKLLIERGTGNLQYQNGWLYYINQLGLFRTFWDGSETQLVSNLHVTDFVMDNSRIYFYEITGFCIYSAKPDGSNPKVAALEALPDLLGAKDGWILYRTSGMNLYRVCADTREAHKITELQNAVFYNGWLYGDNGREPGAMYRMDISKGQPVLLARHSMIYITGEGPNLYYMGNGRLWRLDTDSMIETCLAEGIVSCSFQDNRLVCTAQMVTTDFNAKPLDTRGGVIG